MICRLCEKPIRFYQTRFDGCHSACISRAEEERARDIEAFMLKVIAEKITSTNGEIEVETI